MLEYEFEAIAADRGFFVGKTTGHREAILRRAAEGWRYAGWIPTQQTVSYTHLTLPTIGG